MSNKTDYAIAGLIGFFAGIFIIPMLINLGQSNPVLKSYAVLMAAPWIATVAIIFDVWLGKFLARFRFFSVFDQLSKFGAVGILNTSIDFGILNLLSLITGVTAGIAVGGYNLPGVSVAVVNTYFWNKFWVFRQGGDKSFGDIPIFLLVTISGIVGNSVIVVLGAAYLPHLVPGKAGILLNLAKLFATAFSLAWNFLGYKFFVFKRGIASA